MKNTLRVIGIFLAALVLLMTAVFCFWSAEQAGDRTFIMVFTKLPFLLPVFMLIGIWMWYGEKAIIGKRGTIIE